jgi:hypothetical protein
MVITNISLRNSFWSGSVKETSWKHLCSQSYYIGHQATWAKVNIYFCNVTNFATRLKKVSAKLGMRKMNRSYDKTTWVPFLRELSYCCHGIHWRQIRHFLHQCTPLRARVSVCVCVCVCVCVGGLFHLLFWTKRAKRTWVLHSC